ncbi:MAG: phytanoyl-CoA dioxygenase family protein [Planctomycetes bacterium]|nr:phytanoyl-CoA dioxygenase family protein [Planctomycetota bacterium]
MFDHEQIAAEYCRDGVVRIREFFPPELVDEIRAELERYICDDLDSKPADARTLEADGKTIRNLWRLQLHNDYFRKLGQRPEILQLVGKLVEGEALLTGVETFNKPARIGSGVPYHQDNAYFCQSPPDMLTVWIAIDPVTVENGAVYFITGTHQQGMLPTKESGVTGNSIGMADLPETPKSEQFCATLNPGDATIHHCNVVHHSDPNSTDQSRLGLLLVYRGTHTETDPQLMASYTEAVTATPPA